MDYIGTKFPPICNDMNIANNLEVVRVEMIVYGVIGSGGFVGLQICIYIFGRGLRGVASSILSIYVD